MNDPYVYGKYVNERAKRSDTLLCCVKAFAAGGLICCIGEGFFDIYSFLGADGDTAPTLVSVTLIFITAILTGAGVFDKIAKHAGAGTLVPITGFANAMISQAIDARCEGFILGVGAKIFTVAGPVIVYGAASSVLCGVVFYLVSLF